MLNYMVADLVAVYLAVGFFGESATDSQFLAPALVECDVQVVTSAIVGRFLTVN